MNKEFSPEFTRLRQEGDLGGKGLSSGAAERFHLLVVYNGVVLPR